MVARCAARDEAKAKGELFYFTGIPCPKGHLAPRYTSVYKCTECAKDELKAKREQTAARRAARPLSVREQAKADGATRYFTGKACPRGHFAERATVNGVCVECQREDRLRRNADDPIVRKKRAQYRKKNAERYRSHVRNRRAAAKAIPGSHTKDDILTILEAQNYRCAYCRRSIRRTHHVDHIIALSKGGTNWPSNLQLTCSGCNLRKWNKDPVDFAQELGKLL
jgi:5-methylcytosine-specific restriction endonuclease McrA